MKLRKINIPEDRDWREILPQLNRHSYYLIKYVDKRWYRWIASRIKPAGWVRRDHQEQENVLEKPHSWQYSLGSHEVPFESSSLRYSMDECIKEIYEIVDPELNKREAKKLLSKDQEKTPDFNNPYDQDPWDWVKGSRRIP